MTEVFCSNDKCIWNLDGKCTNDVIEMDIIGFDKNSEPLTICSNCSDWE
jgi:hypothetical protein